MECIKNNPGGLTITDISEITEFSRNTVHKYIKELKDEEKVFTKKVGPYKQYFSMSKFSLPYDTSISYYKAILKNIKRLLDSLPGQNPYVIAKDIGKRSVLENDIHFPFARSTLKQLQGLKGYPFTKAHLDAFPQFYYAYDIFQPNVKIERLKYDEKSQTALYRFSNSIFLENNDNYIYHVYLICGLTEGIIEKAIDREVKVELKGEPFIGTSKENSYFDIEIWISQP